MSKTGTLIDRDMWPGMYADRPPVRWHSFRPGRPELTHSVIEFDNGDRISLGIDWAGFIQVATMGNEAIWLAE